ncbi:stalk domain-containing protein [Paenibacillus xerothermodurans]|uniref:GH26 domain-containing protein n=1 Tax=Paenibacillus xerothermodurans TaxID=1977292 RepID=A0A2W1NDW5_PAEXE|nr:stalk domain-containing protein [Paenibacillus xerothermodurans]PZE22707.1 hypothetical protein CBW46_002775 [Paenibacillus xerothermodurans]
MTMFQQLRARCIKGLMALAVAAGVLTGAPAALADPIWDRWKAADAAVKRGNPGQAVPHWQFLVQHYTSAGDWQNAALFCGRLNQYFDGIKDYENAIKYYELENEYWLKAGKDWGAVDLQRAEQIRTIVDVYMFTADQAMLQRQAAPPDGKLAKLEPEYGMYIGMYSEQDPAMGNNFTKSASLYGKNHAIYLAYSPYGHPFPKQYAVRAKQAGAALQIGWEPGEGLDAVQDDAHLREWARAAKASGIPIFLRYASEMNGNWVKWHGDPQKYIEKFRLVHRVMAEEAPNVAMVWSPGDVPAYSMDAYYPGDDYVDWVGVSMYTEPYENGDPAQGSMQATSPIERLDYLYKTYSARKPLMISETAVSHYAHIPNESFTAYGLLNLHRLYEIMPVKYPRLKAITYFNVDLKDRESRNNYSLAANPSMKSLYTNMIARPYYLTKVEQGAKPADGIGHVPLSMGTSNTFASQTKITPWVKIPDIYIGKINYFINGELIESQTNPPFGFVLEAGEVPEGSTLTLDVYNRAGDKVASKSYPLSSQVSVIMDGQRQHYEQPPVIRNGSTLAPLRAIFESMGAEVTWDAATQTATGRKGDTTVSVSIGKRTAMKNGEPVALDVPAQLINGFTLAPVRFIGEAFDGNLKWHAASRTVQIATSGRSTVGSAALPPAQHSTAADPSAPTEERGFLMQQLDEALNDAQEPDSPESGGLIEWKTVYAITHRSFQAVASFIFSLVSNAA